jgi:hypothetical protein
MDNNQLLIIVFTIVLVLVLLLIGYILGKISPNYGVIQDTKSVKGFFSDNSSQTKSAAPSIDSSKVVIDIKTEGMEKKYDSLGETTQSTENISNSINKLKNMKR